MAGKKLENKKEQRKNGFRMLDAVLETWDNNADRRKSPSPWFFGQALGSSRRKRK